MKAGERLRRQRRQLFDAQHVPGLRELDAFDVQRHTGLEPGQSNHGPAGGPSALGHTLERVSVLPPGAPASERERFQSAPAPPPFELGGGTRACSIAVPRPQVLSNAVQSAAPAAEDWGRMATEPRADEAHPLSVQRVDTYTTPGGHTYTHTSGAAFTPALSNTGAFEGEALREEEQLTRAELEREARRRGDRQPVTDWKVRCEMLRPRIRRADIERARQQRLLEEAGPGAPSVLGVFIAPEWYFKRAPEPYSDKDRDDIIRAMAAMSSDYPHMVIIPGSIVWRRAGSGWLWWRQKARMGNTAPVLFKGSVVKLIHKWKNLGDTAGYAQAGERADDASEDRMLREHGGSARTDQVKKANREYGRNRPATLAQAESSFFQIDNVRFSLEICGDHGRAFDELTQPGRTPFPDGKYANVELLISHGATILGGKPTVKEDTGVAYHADATPADGGSAYGQSSAFTATKTLPHKDRKVLEQVLRHRAGRDERLLLGTYTL